MPIGINSPARNLFLLGSSGAQVVSNFFKLIDQSSTTNNSYVPAEIKYNESDDRYLLSGTALDINLVPNKGFGWFEKRNDAGTVDWDVRVEATSSGVDTTLRAMELDSNGNLIVVGKTGDVPWIAKYSNGGVIDWQSTTNSADVEYTSATSDSNGQYYACGSTPISGQSTAFVEKFDADGNPGWGKSAFMLGRDVVLTKIDANDRGEVVAVGYLEDDTANKGYIIKIDTNTGEVLWDRTLSSQDTTFPLGVLNVKATNVKIDDKGQIYVVGTVRRNSFIIKYTAEGNMLWQKETNLPVGASAPDIQHLGLTVNNVTESVTVASYYFALGANEIYLSNYNKKGDLVWRRSIDQGSSVLSNPSLDNEGAFIYFLFDAGSNTDATYTYGKLSSTGNGLGDFEYNDGTATLIDYQYVDTGSLASDVIGKISDGSVRNDTSDLITYPFNANKILFDDLATQVSNKKRQMDSADSFEYSGSPAIRPTDFSELLIEQDTVLVEEVGQEQSFTTPGSFFFQVPSGVTEISAVCVGAGGGSGNTTGGTTQVAGGGGGGGGLAYGTFAVTPGEILTVTVGSGGVGGGASSTPISGSAGGDTTITRGGTVLLNGGGGGGGSGIDNGGLGQSGTAGVGGTSTGTERDGGGNGGNGGRGSDNSAGGAGGGAGGYSGNGGNGAEQNTNSFGTAGSGGGGSGGGTSTNACGGGGGVGILNGEGTSGGAPVLGAGGAGGSGGTQGSVGDGVSNGGLYGGGGGSDDDDVLLKGGNGAQGAARIIWGTGRSFPSTLTQPSPTISNTYVKDKSKNGYLGKINGATFNASGYWEFVSPDPYVSGVNIEFPNPISADPTSPFTFEVWVWRDTSDKWQTIMSMTGSYTQLAFGSSNTIRFGRNGGLGGNNADSNFSTSTGTWYHVVGTYDGNQSGSNAYVDIYVNGVIQISGTNMGVNELNNGSTIRLGTYGIGSGGEWLNGRIGEARIYPRALTAAQVFQNYNATREKYTGVPASTDPGLTSTRTPA